MNEDVELEEEALVLAETDEPSYVCRLCAIKQSNEPLADKYYCKTCYDHLQQAYQWLQSPMIPAAELKKLQTRIFELTDIQNIKF